MKSFKDSAIAAEFWEKGTYEGCPVIDMHGHYGEIGSGYLPSGNPGRMIESIKKAGYKKIVCSSHLALFCGYTEEGNSVLQEAINEHTDILRGYWAVNPNLAQDSLKIIKDFEASKGFVGFKFLPDYHVYPLDGPLYEPFLEYADSKGLIVLIHTWGGSSFNSPQLVEKIAARYSKAKLLMGHSGFGDWRNSIRIANEIPNVYLELAAVFAAHDFSVFPSGTGTPIQLISCEYVNGIVEMMVEEATSKKVIFGSDLPWYSPSYSLGCVLFARISDDEKHDILHRNAERLLRDICG